MRGEFIIFVISGRASSREPGIQSGFGAPLPLKGGGLGWGSADSSPIPPATPSPTLPLSGGGRQDLPAWALP
jgi:hypothetical protein